MIELIIMVQSLTMANNSLWITTSPGDDAPALNSCTENCSFCWRFNGFDSMHIGDEDDPQLILNHSIKAHLKLISGFKGNPKVTEEKWREASNPKHIAISLIFLDKIL